MVSMETYNPVDAVTEVAKTAKDTLPQTTSQADEALATLLGLFNHFVLFPFKKLNLIYEEKFKSFKYDLQERTQNIPQECFQMPPLSIAGPTIEALRYTYDEVTLREMFLNLLASSMDSRKDSAIHPSYVNIISQMNSLDAILFKHLASQQGYIKAINPSVILRGTDQAYVNAMPEWFIDWDPFYDLFQVSASLSRLSRQGIIELMYDRVAGTDGYDLLKNAPQLKEILRKYQEAHPEQQLEISATRSVLYVNDFGRQFAQTCL